MTMPTKEENALMRKIEKVASNPKRPALTKEEQLDLYQKSRLCLYLAAPSELFENEETENLRKHQLQRIDAFLNLLHEMLITDFGKCLISVHSCQ
jgi:hypothetical protein